MADKLYALIYKPTENVFDVEGNNGVRLNVAVTNAQGVSVANLKGEDFLVSEDGVAQTISFFSHEEAPLAYGIAIDASATFVSEIDLAVETAKTR